MAWTNLASVATQTGANMVSNLQGGLINLAVNKRLANQAYEKELEMWNRANVYNSPVEQMKRLKEAGLNPNLVYGSGAGQSQAVNLPKYQRADANFNFDPVNIMSVLGGYQDVKLKQAQADNVAEQTETRRLDNIVKSGTLQEAIDKVKAETRSSYVKSLLDNLQYNIESQVATYEGTYDENGRPVVMPQTKKRIAELSISQEAAKRTAAEAELKGQELELYKMLKGFGAGSEAARILVDVLRIFMLKKN